MKSRRLGLVEAKAARTLHFANWSLIQIAEALGRDPRTVKRAIKGQLKPIRTKIEQMSLGEL